ncbi:MAG TPA: class I SAM-dependent methyltransferase [Polyangiaceae bacterium]|nr:class I SAM-dependent methyltransferase [Polyangiaceae bacterium]
METTSETMPAAFFDALYQQDVDPWNFESSDYEARKYDETLAALPRQRYRNAFELGCSIGVLTKRLAERCDSLLAVDCSPLALERAIARCSGLDNVRFERMNVPREYPRDASFDLILLSEIAYYWSRPDLKRVFERVVEQLRVGGHVLLVHWAPPGPDKPLTGAEVHRAFLEWADGRLLHRLGRHEGPYWIDLFERSPMLQA